MSFPKLFPEQGQKIFSDRHLPVYISTVTPPPPSHRGKIRAEGQRAGGGPRARLLVLRPSFSKATLIQGSETLKISEKFLAGVMSEFPQGILV